MGLVDVPAGCTILSETVVVEHPAPDLWRERSVVALRAKDACDHVVIDLPFGVHLRDHEVRLRLGDDTKRRPGPERWILSDRGLEDRGTATVMLPELVGGDEAKLTFVREWRGFGWYTTPMADRAVEVSVTLPQGVPREWRGGKMGDDGVWRGDKEVPAEGMSAWDAALGPTAAVTRESGSTADAAWKRVAKVDVMPRGVDGAEPVSGDAGIARAIMDDRGFARTLVALTRGGPEALELAWYLPATALPTGASDKLGPVEQAWEVAILRKDGKLAREFIPNNLHPTGRLWTADRQVLPASSVSHGKGRLAAKQVRITDTTTLVVPDGDPQSRLFPGGGSSVERQLRFDFQPDDYGQVFVVPFATAPTPEKPDASWRIHHREDATVITVAPSPDDPVRVDLARTTPDAPTCGALPTWEWADTAATVTDPKGIVKTEGGFWWLAEHQGKPVMPDRERVLRGLAYRFTSSAYPEPAIPQDLRGMARGWDFAAALRDALLDEVHVTRLAVPTNWPRKLMKAKREEVMTPLEVALTLRLMLIQARMPADVVLVRPIQQGDGPEICPDAYPDVLVRVFWNNEVRWMDPGCRVCAPFEVRPDLLGASAFGVDITKTPPAPPGSLAWSVTGDEVTVAMDPAAALSVRLWLQDLPRSEREERLAERFGGEGSALLKADGLGEAGAAVNLTIRSPNADRPGPTTLVEDLWWPFVGEIRYEAPSPPTGRERVRAPANTGHGAVLVPATRDSVGAHKAEAGPWSYERTVTGGRVNERLVIKDRRLSSEEYSLLYKARSLHAAPRALTASPTVIRAMIRGGPATFQSSGEQTPGSGPLPRALPPGTLVDVLGPVDADTALVVADGLYGRVPRASLVTFPFPSRVRGKGASMVVRATPDAKGKRAMSLPVAGGLLWVVEAKPGWVKIDVEGPESATRIGGWIPATDLDDTLAGNDTNPSAIGDWTFDRWSPWNVDAVILDKPTTIRGLDFPEDTLVQLAANGRIVGVELFRTWTDGADTRLPAGSTLRATESCDVQLVTPSAGTVGGLPIPSGMPACLEVRDGHPTLHR